MLTQPAQRKSNFLSLPAVFELWFLYWADQLGYIVWDEFADWGLDLSRPQSYLIVTREWEEALERDFNHSSLIGWCPLNEGWESAFPGVIEGVFRFIKVLDPRRLVIDSSGGYYLVSPDVYDSHNCGQDAAKFNAGFDGLFQSPRVVFVNGDPERNKPYRGQPYYISEYGGIWRNSGQTDEKA